MTKTLPPLTPMICAYPECRNMIWITVQQKREFKTYNVLKYGDSLDPYCSIECQQKHFKDLAESEFLDKGTIKNRDYALIVHSADVSKRLKEKEVHVISGNITEQRARCLFEKLNSILPRNKKRYLTSKDVQEFLLNELPANLKPPAHKIEVTAWVIMNKTKKLYPNAISINHYKGKSKYIELII